MPSRNWLMEENEVVSSSGKAYSDWKVTMTWDNPIATSDTFTISYPTLVAVYTNSNSTANKDGAYIRYPISLMDSTNGSTKYFTNPAVYACGKTYSEVSSANTWTPGTTKALEQKHAGTPKSGALIKNTADYFDSSNPTTKTVNLGIAWGLHSKGTWTYSGSSKAYAVGQSYHYKSSGCTYINRWRYATDAEAWQVFSYELQVTLNAPPTASGFVSTTQCRPGETVSVYVSGSAQYGGYISSYKATLNGTTSSGSGTGGTLTFTAPSSPGTYTVYAQVTDSRSQTSSSINIGTVTVQAYDPPTVSIVPNASEYEYGSNITLTVNATAASGSSITSIDVRIGTSSSTVYSRTVYSSGAVTFTNCTSVGEYYIYATAHDNHNQSTTAQGQKIKILAAKNPTFSVNDPPGGSYDAGTTYSCEVSNVVTYQSSGIQSIVLTVGTSYVTSQAGGTLTLRLPDSGMYTPSVTVTDTDGRSTTQNLRSISIRNTAIYVDSLSTRRISKTTDLPDEDGEEDPGTDKRVTNALLTGRFVVKADTFRPPTVKVAGSIYNATWYFNYSDSTGFSNPIGDWSAIVSETVVAYARIVGTFFTDTTYMISVIPNSSSETGTELATYLPQAFYLLAGRAGGKALGIGQKPSADNLFEVVMTSNFLAGIHEFYVTANDGDLHSLLDLIYPVDSYYETSDNNFDPNTYWGGTWTRTADVGRNRWHRSR